MIFNPPLERGGVPPLIRRRPLLGQVGGSEFPFGSEPLSLPSETGA